MHNNLTIDHSLSPDLPSADLSRCKSRSRRRRTMRLTLDTVPNVWWSAVIDHNVLSILLPFCYSSAVVSVATVTL
jgi:hypothetical protein